MAEESANIDLNRVRQLALERCGSVLSEEHAEELSELLSTSDKARSEYWEIISIHSELEWELGGKESADDALARQIAEFSPTSTPWSRGLPTLSLPPGWWLALAASLLIAAIGGLTIWSKLGPPYPAEHVVDSRGAPASIVGQLAAITSKSSWSFGRTGANNASDCRQGDTIWLESGAAELRLTSGTVASLQAPVIMQAVSVDRLRLISGGIKVNVAKGAEGFSVETETAEVIDLGTVFSVDVAEGNTDLVVFDGEVDLKVPAATDEPSGLIKRFRAGEAVQVARDGTLSRIVDVQQTDYASLEAGFLGGAVITQVRDNNTRDDLWSFYEIVPGGMKEDANAFVDRPHEWNGVHSSGMPSYLVGGDYVKTFNDDKVIGKLSIDVALARPATLYVLLDKRVAPPAWLLESFENTGDEIGVDEVHFKPETTPHYDESQLSIGAGKGVNRQHSVWKQRVPRGGIVSLGANGELVDVAPEGVMSKSNMYGIVAVPLRPEI